MDQRDVEVHRVLREIWRPGAEGEPLAPPGFHPKRRIINHPSYIKDHPTRYTFAMHIIPLIRKIYRQIGGPDFGHCNTYVYHPPYNPPDIARNYQFYSMDWWGGRGRGFPIAPWVGEQIVDIVWNDPGEPYLWYYIWRGYIYSRYWDWHPVFWASPDDSFNYHGDHPHFTCLKPGAEWF